MRAVVQRVSRASVVSEGETTGVMEAGLLVFLGVEDGDTDQDLRYLCGKLTGLRIFDDENGTPNRSVTEAQGKIMLISQFTLLGDARHGRRPSYIKAARPEVAEPMYAAAVSLLSESVPVETGRFQTNMQVSLVNDGPFTILLDSRRNF